MEDIKRAFLTLEDLAPNTVRWFSIAKDGNPFDGVTVLVTRQGVYGRYVDRLTFDKGEWYGSDGIPRQNDIVSWAWLPSPDERSETDGRGVD